MTKATGAQGGPPGAVRAFAVLFTAQGLIAFAAALADLPAGQAALAATFPGLSATHDLAIVAACARLTIVLIPVALAWCRRARLVRWLVPAMLGMRVLTLGADMPPVEWLALVLAAAATACLFTPAARRWFAPR